MTKIALLLGLVVCFFSDIQGQTDSLDRYTLTELDSLYKTKKQAQDRLPYALAMLKKGEKDLDTQDNAYTELLYNVGINYVYLGDFANAGVVLEQSNLIFQQKKQMHVEHANCLNLLGTVYYYQGLFDEAEKCWVQTLAIRKELLGEEHPDYAGVLHNLGGIYQYLGDVIKSKAYYFKAMEIQKKVLGEEHQDYALTLSSLAILSFEIGDFASAEKYGIQTLKIEKNVLGEEHPDYASTLNNLGNVYVSMGDYTKAESYFRQALNIFNKSLEEGNFYYASNFQNLGTVYFLLGNYTEAEKYTLKALDVYKTALGEENPDYGLYLGEVSRQYYAFGDYEKAESYLLQALEIIKASLGEDHHKYAALLNNLGAEYMELGIYSKAEKYLLQSADVNKKVVNENHPQYLENLSNLGKLYKKIGNYPKAEIYYADCFKAKNSNLATNFSWLPEKGKAAYWQQEKGFYQDINNYSAQTADVFPKATALAYNGNLVAKGLLLESSKEIEEAVSKSKDSTTLAIYQQIKDKRRLINHLVSSGSGNSEVIASYENETDSLDKILVGRLGEYTNSKRKFQITWQDVQGALAENEAAIEFARYQNPQDSQYYYMALVVRKNYELPKLVKLGAEKTIAEIPAGKGLGDLYKLIWQPIDSFLNEVETVYYSPDGYLNNIAFAALCNQGTEKVINTKEIKRGNVGKTASKISDCTFLSERYTLHQLSITRYLAEGLKTSQVDNSLLVFGGVNYEEIPLSGDTLAAIQVFDFEDYAFADNLARSSNNQSRMEYLPGTQTELQNLQKIMQKKQWKIRAFSDKNASENTLKMELKKEVPSVLHIATHGFAFPDLDDKKNENKTYRDADNPMARCGLLLAGANHSWTGNPKTVLAQSGEDAILTALEVSNLPLSKTKLVVLSACETGLGKIQGTEGVFGLKRGFKLAGVEQIIVSLWSVPDKETMELMEIFYNDLAKTRNAVTSFEKAQKEMQKKYRDRPDLWAGFVLVR